MTSPWPFGDLRMFGYDVVEADPPWDFETWSTNGNAKGAPPHYELMTMDAIAAFPVGHLARGDCLLLLWATAPLLPPAIAVMGRWGFAYKTHLIWRKVTRNGKVRWGTGYRARTGHEVVLVGTTGNPAHKPFPSIFDGLARQHSRKPTEFYDMVERCSPRSTRASLFSRQSRAGWHAWGREAGKFDAVAA